MPILSQCDFLCQIRVYGSGANLLGLYDDFVSLQYKKEVNKTGLAVLTVSDTHPILALLADDLLLEVYFIFRPISGGEITDTKDFMGLYRDKQVATDGDGNIHYLLYFPGTIEIMARNIIAYYPGINNKTSWVGQTIAIIVNDLVKWNCTSFATTANGRARNANVIRNFSIGGGVTSAVINYSVSYRNVLEVVQELAELGNFDFDVVRVSLVNTDLALTLYAGQLGTDKHTTIIFDMNLDNVAAANLNGERLQEKTIAIVGGQDVGAARAISVRSGLNQSASNDYETFVDARSNETAELASIGDAKLADLEARINIDIDIAPSSGYVYRRDYTLGDLVTASFAGTRVTKKISTVEVRFEQDQNTTIRIELTNP